MTSANIQRKTYFFEKIISIAIGLVLSAGLSATATSSYDISTIAGSNTASFSGDGSAATAATLNGPRGVFLDSARNVYIADYNNNHIRKITASSGVISSIAGGSVITAGFAGDGGAATDAAVRLNIPNSVCVDNLGNLYIADTTNHRIRMVINTAGTYFGSARTAGNIYTIAGTGTAGFADGSATTAAMLSSPRGIWADSTGTNVYIADYGNHLIRKLNGTSVTTVAGTNSGTSSGYSGDGGLSTAASMSNPGGVCKDSFGNFYFADTANNCIRQITTAGIISTLSGFTLPFALNGPRGICVDSSNNLYVANTSGNSILKRTSGGTVSALSFGALTAPQGVFADNFGNIFVANTGGNNIKMLWGAATTGGSNNYVNGTVYTLASSLSPPPLGIWAVGSATPANNRVYFTDGTRRRFFQLASTSNGSISVSTSSPNNAIGIFGIAGTPSDTIYITTTENTVRYFTYTYGTRTPSTVTTIAGTGISGFSGDGASATAAQLSSPYGIFVNGSTVYVADSVNNRIRQFTVGGNISTFAGPNGGFSGDDSPATTAKLNSPSGVYVNGSAVYVADSGNNRIRQFTVGGPISTIAGNGTATFSGDGGTATAASLNAPSGICVDSAGNVYIADTTNNRIRKITASTGLISTIAGTGAGSFSGDGSSSTAASLNSPNGVFVDSAGNVYIADSGNNRIRKLLSKLAFSGSGTLSATATGTAYIQGGGTAVLPPSNSIDAVEVNNGTLQVSSSAPITFNASGGSAMVEILAAIRTGAFTLRTPGAVKIATGIAAILDAPSGTSLMSKTGAGRLRAVDDLSSSTTPVAVSEGILEVSGASGKLPTAAISVASGAILELGTSVANGAVPGTVDIASGGIVSVAAGVTAPSNVFSNATIPVFHGGAIIQLGANSTFLQAITVVA